MALNTFTDISSIAQAVQVDADFVMRESTFITNLITNFGDKAGGNVRTRYDYNASTVNEVGESDDLTSQALTPSAGSSLTPIEDGAQFFITDKRAETDAPENILSDAATELGMAFTDKLSQNIYNDFDSLTGGTIGAAGTVITWGYVFAAISQARVAIKNHTVPLSMVLHTYQWHVLAKTASVAGANVVNAPQFQDEIMRNWWAASVAGCNIFVSPAIPIITGTDAYGAVFARQALAYDVRRSFRVEGERDASRRGVELNGSHLYAHGVWRPTFGVQMLFDCATPTS